MKDSLPSFFARVTVAEDIAHGMNKPPKKANDH